MSFQSKIHKSAPITTQNKQGTSAVLRDKWENYTKNQISYQSIKIEFTFFLFKNWE